MASIRGFGSVYRRKRSRFWWIAYQVNRKQVRESSKSEKKSDAKRLLQKRLQEAQSLTMAPGKLSVDEALKAYVDDAELRGIRSVGVFRRSRELVATQIGTLKANEVTTYTLKSLQKKFCDLGYGPATVNRNVGFLFSALRFASRVGLISNTPTPPTQLKRPKPREGFFEHHEFKAMRDGLPDWGKGILEFGYITGWRRGSVLWLRWDEVREEEGVVRLDPDRSKTGDSVVWPLDPLLERVIERQRRQRMEGVRYVFHREGSRVSLGVWRRTWCRAAKSAGLDNRVFHDCRRTAVRNLVRSGVPEVVAMRLTGHRTRSVFDRYNIVNSKDLSHAARQLTALYEQEERRETQTRLLPFQRSFEKSS